MIERSKSKAEVMAFSPAMSGSSLWLVREREERRSDGMRMEREDGSTPWWPSCSRACDELCLTEGYFNTVEHTRQYEWHSAEGVLLVFSVYITDSLEYLLYCYSSHCSAEKEGNGENKLGSCLNLILDSHVIIWHFACWAYLAFIIVISHSGKWSEKLGQNLCF